MKVVYEASPTGTRVTVVRAISFYDENGWPFSGKKIAMRAGSALIDADGDLTRPGYCYLDWRYPIIANLSDGTHAVCSEIGLRSFLGREHV